MGVILYILLCGSPPFYGPNNDSIRDAVLKRKFEFDSIFCEVPYIGPIWRTISKECKDLISRMLRPAAKRLSAIQVIDHEWLKLMEIKVEKGLALPIVVERLDKFRNYEKIKQAVLTYLATQLSEREISPLRMCFLSIDKNGDGILSTEEVTTGLAKFKIDFSLEDIVEALDTNQSGFIDYNGTNYY